MPSLISSGIDLVLLSLGEWRSWSSPVEGLTVWLKVVPSSNLPREAAPVNKASHQRRRQRPCEAAVRPSSCERLKGARRAKSREDDSISSSEWDTETKSTSYQVEKYHEKRKTQKRGMNSMCHWISTTGIRCFCFSQREWMPTTWNINSNLYSVSQ